MRQLLSQEFDDAAVAEFEVDPKDYLIASKYIGRTFSRSDTQRAGWKSTPFVKFLVFAIIGIFFVVLYDFFQNIENVAERNTIGLVAGLIAAIVFVCLIFLVFLFWIIRSRISKRMSEAVRGERQLVWRGRNGLLIETPSTSVFFDYKGIDEVVALARGNIVRSGLLGFYIPDSGFKTENERKEFLALLKSKLEAQALSSSSIFSEKGALSHE